MIQPNQQFQPKMRSEATGPAGNVRESDVPAALTELESSTLELDAVLCSLRTRLEPLMRLEPGPPAMPEQTAPGDCQLSRSIRQQTFQVQEATRGIHRMLDQLEV